MESKKYPIADLGNYHGLIFSSSLVITLLLINAAFNWRQNGASSVDLVAKGENRFEEMIEVPITQMPEPPPAVVVQPQIVEVPNEELIKEEIKIDFNIEINENTVMPDLAYQPAVTEPEENPDEIFVVVETTASPKGGIAQFYEYISANLVYPPPARRMRVEGKVFVEFVINKDGTITDVKAVKGIGAGCNEEAVRVIQNAPAWNPAKQRGKPVRQKMVLPIYFKMAKD